MQPTNSPTDTARALILAGAILFGGGIATGRMTAPVQPPVKQEPAPEQEQKKELPPLPKLVAPKPIMKPERRDRGAKSKSSGLPSCARVKVEYDRMTIAQRWAAYRKATPEQIRHGRLCLGL